MIENQLGYKVKTVRVDNGSKYVNQRFNFLFKELGVLREPTVTYTPE